MYLTDIVKILRVLHSIMIHCLRQTIDDRKRLIFDDHLNVFSTKVHQNTVIVAFSVDFYSQVSSHVPNPKHSFHFLICIITTAAASQHLPLRLFFHVYVNLRRQEIHSSSSNSNFSLFSKVLQHNTLTNVGILKLCMIQQQQQQTLHSPWGTMLTAVQGRI